MYIFKSFKIVRLFKVIWYKDFLHSENVQMRAVQVIEGLSNTNSFEVFRHPDWKVWQSCPRFSARNLLLTNAIQRSVQEVRLLCEYLTTFQGQCIVFRYLLNKLFLLCLLVSKMKSKTYRPTLKLIYALRELVNALGNQQVKFMSWRPVSVCIRSPRRATRN